MWHVPKLCLTFANMVKILNRFLVLKMWEQFGYSLYTNTIPELDLGTNVLSFRTRTNAFRPAALRERAICLWRNLLKRRREQISAVDISNLPLLKHSCFI